MFLFFSLFCCAHYDIPSCSSVCLVLLCLSSSLTSLRIPNRSLPSVPCPPFSFLFCSPCWCLPCGISWFYILMFLLHVPSYSVFDAAPPRGFWPESQHVRPTQAGLVLASVATLMVRASCSFVCVSMFFLFSSPMCWSLAFLSLMYLLCSFYYSPSFCPQWTYLICPFHPPPYLYPQ